jgi:chromosome segregation ATPase
VNDNENDCGDNSDEGVQLSAEEEDMQKISREEYISANNSAIFTAFASAFITAILVQRKRSALGFEKYSVIDGLESKINDSNNRVRTLKKEKKNRNKINSKLSELRKELSELESGIKGSNKLRDSTEREIKLLEKEIAQLWESIAHLIPFSTALEKA